VVEFTLVTVVLLVLFVALLQLGIALYVRNTLVACAAEGARYGANADRSPGDAAAHAEGLIDESLGVRFSRDVTARTAVIDGVPQVEVRVTSTLPLIGVFGPRSLRVAGHALDEG
jgi:hypothetical protein